MRRGRHAAPTVQCGPIGRSRASNTVWTADHAAGRRARARVGMRVAAGRQRNNVCRCCNTQAKTRDPGGCALFLSNPLLMVPPRYRGEYVDMGLRNYLGRTLLLLVLALAVGIAVAIVGGEERARTVERGGLSTIEHGSAVVWAPS